MALELMQSRYADDAGQSFHESLADCMVNQGVYVGPELDKATAITTNAIQIKVTQGDKVRELDGKHPNDRAIDGLIWLVNYMSKRGVAIEAGAAIITGSFKGIVNMAFDVETTIAYEGLGEYAVTFKRA
jgi:2-keto-4-pentenoate hydratase